MAKIKYKNSRKNSQQVRQAFKFFYENKFYKKWMSKFDFSGLNYQQKDFIMKKLWFDGTIACSEPIGIPSGIKELMEEDSIIFTPWTMQGLYNIYDFPTKALPINLRGVSFISTRPLALDEEIVIIYCQKNHKSVYSTIECKLNELVDIEMIIRVCLKAQKQAFLFTSTPENKVAIEKLANDLDSDEPTLFTTLDSNEIGNGFQSSAPYIVDKLEMQRQKIEDDILSLLGCNNVGIAEKKEHLLNGEIDANNQSIQESGNEFYDLLKEGFDRVNEVFGKSIQVIDLTPKIELPQKEEQDEQGDEENE